ncbi:hypothetical protein [Actinacidiphila sp. ITFR-21]|uniref:hypothetical protein n=1 Tax=Actinacidiphila sp. ITFR-21 TaxID=3075199 RepID=UPI0037DA57EA
MTAHQEAAISDADRADARTIWDFHQMGHGLRPCSAAIALGSLDLGVATTSAELYHAGMFPVAPTEGLWSNSRRLSAVYALAALGAAGLAAAPAATVPGRGASRPSPRTA